MRIAFMVNQRSEPTVDQTTTGLIRAALGRDHEVTVFGVGDLTLTDAGELRASGCRLNGSQATEAVIRHLQQEVVEDVNVGESELWILRTNPARDERGLSLHIAALRMAERASSLGVAVINDPRGLSRALTKLSLRDLPFELQPRTLVTRDANEIASFIQEVHRAVIKPLQGTRGQDVFAIGSPSSQNNTNQIIDVVLRQGYAVVQEFVDGAELGDIRVFVLDGEVLVVDGAAAVVARVPHASDFRSNIHARGKGTPGEVTDEMRATVNAIAPYLAQEGVVQAGVDFVGGKILEINVFSPGGLIPAERMYDASFTAAAIECFERKAGRSWTASI